MRNGFYKKMLSAFYLDIVFFLALWVCRAHETIRGACSFGAMFFDPARKIRKLIFPSYLYVALMFLKFEKLNIFNVDVPFLSRKTPVLIDVLVASIFKKLNLNGESYFWRNLNMVHGGKAQFWDHREYFFRKSSMPQDGRPTFG